MKNLDNIAEELFNKIRGRFPKITIGDAQSVITNEPKEARFFDFELSNGEKVNVSLDEESVTVMYSNNLFDDNEDSAKDSWYNFLKELRQFSKKRMLNFDTRDITKSNLDKRDYEYLAKQHGGETTMSESKMYGTSRTSFQDIGNARMIVKHSEPVNQELASGRSQKIHSIYVENADGERFKYPFKHLNGARAVARHVAEGGNLYDDIGQHIVSLSEELSKLRKFKTYMNRSTVMAEGLSGYMDVVYDRIATVKKTVESLQKEAGYKSFVETFEPKASVEVPEDVQSDWIDQLTIRQFNEELKGVFPYIYNLVSEANAIQELGPDDLLSEKEDDPCWKGYKQIGMKKKGGKEVPNCVPEEMELEAAYEEAMGQFAEGDVEDAPFDGAVEKKKGEYKDKFGNTVKDKNIAKHLAKKGMAQAKDEDTEEGNAYAHAVRKAKMDGKKKGDKVQGPDGDEITIEKDEKTPLGEFILSYFDRESGQFPKGETAVLTMVEKDYGEEYITPAKQFIEMINNKVAEVMGYREGTVSSVGDTNDDDMEVGFKGNQGGKVGLSTKDDNPFAGNVGKKAPAGHKSAADKLKALKGEETERLRKLAGL